MDSGLFTVILLHPEDSDGLLEIADRQTTKETTSEAIGNDERAKFRRVTFQDGEVIVLAGQELERIFGRERVPACVYRVRRPSRSATLTTEERAVGRYSVAIFSQKKPSQ